MPTTAPTAPTTHTYTPAHERSGWDGLTDKLALCDAMAWKYAGRRDLHEAVLAVVSRAGSGADEIMRAWEAYCESLPYRREAGEVLRDPMQTLKHGGDCDDLAILFTAGCRALAIPCRMEIIAHENGDGYHIRCQVGLPPLRPRQWVVVDPVRLSEGRWAMSDGRAPVGRLDGQKSLTMAERPCACPARSGSMMPLLLGLGAGWLVGRMLD